MKKSSSWIFRISIKLSKSNLWFIVGFFVVVMGCTNQQSQTQTAQIKSYEQFGFQSYTDLQDKSLGENLYKVMSQFSGNPDWQRKWWIEKTVRILRAGQGLNADEDIENFFLKSDETILDELIQDPRFADMVLDFGMYFLGFKANAIKKNGYLPAAFDFAQAIDAAKAVATNGDFFQLLSLYGTTYPQPLLQVFSDPGDPYESSLTSDQIRHYRVTKFVTMFDQLIELSSKDPAGMNPEICVLQKKYFQDINNQLFTLVPFQVLLPILFADSGFYSAYALCGTTPAVENQKLHQAFIHIKATLVSFFDEYHKFLPSQYQPKSILDFKALDTKKVYLNEPFLQISSQELNGLPNSSTNFNRKRGARILKRYFCDDLTPVGFESDGDHAQSGHGSSPQCMTCHFKLDPMAGFFKDRGRFFFDYKGKDQITLDDGVTVQKDSYDKTWRSSEIPGKEWNIGYIRNAVDYSQNTYGQDLFDLEKILKTAPEVRTCIVKRLFQYLVSENQTLDAGYLDYLTEKFNQKAKENSAIAFKDLVKNIVLSKSFSTQDAKSNECYDFSPGEDPKNLPPCRVAFLLQKNCVQCHSSSNSKGNLDLSRWIPLTDTKKGFPHFDSQGKQIERSVTMTRISERLTTNDTELRMPYRKTMSGPDRQEIFLWIQQELQP